MAWNADAIKRLPERVLEMGRARFRRKVELTKTQAAAAVWLRGNNMAFNTLREIIQARVSARGLSPVPTEPVLALIDKARDNECLRIIAELEMILNSPMPSLNEGDEEGI